MTEYYDKIDRWVSHDEKRKTRVITTKFLWFPKTIHTTTKWLCRGKIKQKLNGGLGDKYINWQDKEWVDEEENKHE